MVFIMAAGGLKGSLAFVKSLYTDPFRWFVYFFVYGCSCGYLLVPGTLLLLRGRKRRKKRRQAVSLKHDGTARANTDGTAVERADGTANTGVN